ncbi:hypothetical protein EVG20_g4241 [Dentipellis fragilis]|uniref:AB hydrolase-1 domain-containing protein n=1 Tax=Dentipellis fragilis TaxID=205917 RepID=A0A4Y9YYV0_9AGAM|nr:hypothetical protein EVG20_g4241 [Dentipellis fragilis]
MSRQATSRKVRFSALHRETYTYSSQNCTNRLFTTRVTPIDLRYECQHPANGNNTDKPLVILHGLFGMKRNWSSLAKAFCKELQRPVYALDLRNHGASPHVEPMNYDVMATDVLHFMESHSLTNVSLLGHSMGGKAAMALALSPQLPEGLLQHLIVADIAPSRGRLSKEFQSYIRAMQEIDAAHVKTRHDAQHILSAYESDPMTRAFLLTNLDTSSTPLRFRIPLDILGSAIPALGDFPYEPGERTWTGKTLFIKGTKSRFINERNLPVAKQFFPNMQLKTLAAGHWVHAEKPAEFLRYVIDFIKE